MQVLIPTKSIQVQVPYNILFDSFRILNDWRFNKRCDTFSTGLGQRVWTTGRSSTRGYVDRKFLSKPQKHALVAIRIIYSRSNKYPNKYLHTYLSTYCRHITSIPIHLSIYLPTDVGTINLIVTHMFLTKASLAFLLLLGRRSVLSSNAIKECTYS